jgi:hypothetical protein
MAQKLRQIDIQVRQEVHFIDQHQLRRPEHERVFEGLVLPFGHRGDHHAAVLADLELGGADQVAHVLDDEHV